MKRNKFVLLAILLLLSNHLFADDSPATPPPVQDPYEPFNRVMYNFNDFLDNGFVKPAATLYNKIIPKPIVKGIGNFFSNLNNVPTIINDVLQGNLYQSASDSWRLGINSTIGLLGFFDVAAEMGLERNSEDLGLTFAHWGWKDSNYLVLPFLGPSTVRDGIAWPINYEYLTVYPYINNVTERRVLFGLGILDKRADLQRFQSVFDQAAIDRYVFIRNAYLQRRGYLIQRNKELGDPYLEKNTKT